MGAWWRGGALEGLCLHFLLPCLPALGGRPGWRQAVVLCVPVLTTVSPTPHNSLLMRPVGASGLVPTSLQGLPALHFAALMQVLGAAVRRGWAQVAGSFVLKLGAGGQGG